MRGGQKARGGTEQPRRDPKPRGGSNSLRISRGSRRPADTCSASRWTTAETIRSPWSGRAGRVGPKCCRPLTIVVSIERLRRPSVSALQRQPSVADGVSPWPTAYPASTMHHSPTRRWVRSPNARAAANAARQVQSRHHHLPTFPPSHLPTFPRSHLSTDRISVRRRPITASDTILPNLSIDSV